MHVFKCLCRYLSVSLEAFLTGKNTLLLTFLLFLGVWVKSSGGKSFIGGLLFTGKGYH